MKGKLKNEKDKTNSERVPVILHDNFVHGGNERDGERGGLCNLFG